MSNLSRDEETVLLIATKGERMMPIGKWKAPVETLTAKGLLVTQPNPGDPTGNFNCVITPAGRAAADQLDTDYDLVPGMIEQDVAAIVQEREKLRAEAEHIARQAGGAGRQLDEGDRRGRPGVGGELDAGDRQAGGGAGVMVYPLWMLFISVGLAVLGILMFLWGAVINGLFRRRPPGMFEDASLGMACAALTGCAISGFWIFGLLLWGMPR